MKQRFILFRRNGTFYCEDTSNGKQTSLRTKDESEATALLAAKNEAIRHVSMNLQLAQVYLQHSDPALAGRTWADVMQQVSAGKTGPTKERYDMAIQDAALDGIRHRKLLETTGEQFLSVLRAGTVSTNVYLRRFHNFALGMHWLPWPILPRLHWPN
ncbi:MAG TPA: hypothetical protein VHH73_15350, partial [Verrucomicrobiae bacterium]|nr:hypothetical protein [Verrucomicrobiae bacterium]